MERFSQSSRCNDQKKGRVGAGAVAAAWWDPAGESGMALEVVFIGPILANDSRRWRRKGRRCWACAHRRVRRDERDQRDQTAEWCGPEPGVPELASGPERHRDSRGLPSTPRTATRLLPWKP